MYRNVMNTKRCLSAMAALGLVLGARCPVMAQASDFYAGKARRIIVGLEAGGTVDPLARGFSIHLRKHISIRRSTARCPPRCRCRRPSLHVFELMPNPPAACLGFGKGAGR
jgi:hypothetical protein